jgi:hypothetical protein
MAPNESFGGQNEDNYKLPHFVHHTETQFAICTHRYGPQPTHPPTYPSTKPSAKSAWFFKGMQKERNKIEMMPWMIRIYV